MKINTALALNLEMSTKDFAVIMTTYDYIKELVNVLPKGSDMICTGTGEVISQKELGRVLGILDGLTNGYDWICSPN